MTQLAPNRLQMSEFKRTEFRIEPEAKTPIETVLQERYWAHVSVKLKRGDRIEVHAEDDAYFAELLVLDAGKLYAKVKLLSFSELYGTLEESQRRAGDYWIDWRGPKDRWCGLCLKDVLATSMTQDAAVAWLGERAVALQKPAEKPAEKEPKGKQKAA
jgi:hypothetical protein